MAFAAASALTFGHLSRDSSLLRLKKQLAPTACRRKRPYSRYSMLQDDPSALQLQFIKFVACIFVIHSWIVR